MGDRSRDFRVPVGGGGGGRVRRTFIRIYILTRLYGRSETSPTKLLV